MNPEEHFDVIYDKGFNEKNVKYNGKEFLVFYGNKELLKHKNKAYDSEKYIKDFFPKNVVKKQFTFLGKNPVIIVPGKIELYKYKKENNNFVSQIDRKVYDDEKKDLCKIISKEFGINDEAFISWDADEGIYKALSDYLI
jgi:hypothetical protein